MKKRSFVILGATWIFFLANSHLSIAATLSLDGNNWLLATDPDNVGRDEQWFRAPRDDARQTRVPGILQETFPRYHGVVWYWHDFDAPENPNAEGRYLLRFWQVDYLADVWVNGVHVGEHEGTGDPFVLDVTDAIKPQAKNRVSVRVLNPTDSPIDGYVLNQTTMWARGIPCKPGLALNYGGLVDSVELIVAPAVRVEDLTLQPDWHTGEIKVQANLRNAGSKALSAQIDLAVSPATHGEAVDQLRTRRKLPVGDTLIEEVLKVPTHRLWELNDPYLYRVTVSVGTDNTSAPAEQTARCGFRDFRFEDGFFRLNGRRLFIKSTQTDARAPVGHLVPLDPDLVRRDLVNCKATRHNMIRSFGGQIPRYQIDMCDEIGLLVYQEHAGAWRMGNSPKIGERFERSVRSMIKRDRNHPSVVIWGILNETGGPVYQEGLRSLPWVREMDTSRAVLLSSGDAEFTKTGKVIANRELTEWENTFVDTHQYASVPHRIDQIEAMRNLGDGDLPVFHSEGGIGSAINLVRLARHYERLDATDCEDARIGRNHLDRFLADWQQWNLDDTFANPEDYFYQCVAWMANVRKIGANALRANPNLVAYNITGLVDPSTTGEGMLASTFRELKPGVVDAMFDALSPLRWCLFVQPVQIYRGDTARLEAVLANEDVLPAGDYPVRFQVVGPNNVSLFDRTLTVSIPEPAGKPEPSFAIPVLNEEIKIDGPPGRYRFLANFQKGAAADGGDIEFHVADAEEMPTVDHEVVLWGNDSVLANWLAEQGIRTRPFKPGRPTSREVILVGKRPNVDDAAKDDYWKSDIEPDPNAPLPEHDPGLVILKNFDPIQRNGHEGKPLNLNGKLYPHGIFAHAHSRIVVQLPGPGKSFTSKAGILSDHAAAGGQGSVVFSVSLGENELFRSGVQREGMKELDIDVDLEGQSLFTLEITDGGDGIAADQACWADAKITLVDGREIWLADLETLDVNSQDTSHSVYSGAYACAMRELARHIAHGSHVIYLMPDVLTEGQNQTRWMPLSNKGALTNLPIWLYHKDDWGKNHPIFAGLPSGCVLDHTYYREVLNSGAVWSGQDPPAEAVAGSINAGLGYSSGLTVAVYDLGAGRFTLNTLRLHDQLGSDPVAERLFRNMLNHAAQRTDQPVAELPADFKEQLRAMRF